jgi:tetratricopeptide (TPR) repeat protein
MLRSFCVLTAGFLLSLSPFSLQASSTGHGVDSQSTGQSAASPPSPLDALAQASQMLDRGEVDKAVTTLKAIQSQTPDLKGLDRALGVAYYRQGDYLHATAYLDKAIAIDPEDKESVQLLGLAYFFTGKPKNAIPLLEKVQAWYPSAHVDASYVLGVCYVQVMNYDSARKAFATMYGVPPDSGASHLFLARMLMRQGYDTVAEQEVNKSIETDPRLPMAHFLLGEMYIFKSRIPEAIKAFEAEMSINPAHSATYYRLADAYTRVQRWDDAEKLLQRSIWLDATASGPYILMGKVLLKKNDAVLAIRSLQRALAMDPNNYITHNLLGQAYRMQGKTAEAENELQLSQKLQDAQGQSKAELQ